MFKSINRLLSKSANIQKLAINQIKVEDDTLFSHFFKYLKNENLVVGPNLEQNFMIMKRNIRANNLKGYQKSLNKLDKESMNNLDTAKNQISALMDALIEVSAGSTLNLRAFDQSLTILESQYNKNPTRENFLKLCFYYGMYKKCPPGPEKLKEILSKHFDKFIDDLNTVEFAIVCTATFKASVKIPSDKFRSRLIQEVINVTEIDNNARIFVCFIKSLRQNLINAPEVIDKLKELSEKGKLENIDYKSTIQILPLIADNGMIEPELTRTLIEKFFMTINDEIRVKDIQKFIYSCALLNFQLKQKNLHKLEDLLIQKSSGEEYEKYFDCFVDSILSLWILNYRSKTLIDKLLNDKRLYMKGDKSRIKIDSRKLLLMTCVEIEEPTWIEGVKIRENSFDVNRHSPVYLIKPSLQQAKNELNDPNAKFVQQIKNLNIAGILSRVDENETHFEVLDNSNTLNNGKTPNGILALKLRLLKQMNCKCKLLNFVSR